MSRKPAVQPRATRHRAFKGARIIFNNLASTIDCVVHDLSETGARLDVETVVGIPDSFELIFDDGLPTRQCIVERRTPQALGVRFLDEPSAGPTGLRRAAPGASPRKRRIPRI